MELLSRYRNVTVLLLVILAQLVLLGYQVRSGQDVRLIRVWAVTAVTPVAKVIESVRSTTTGWVGKYIWLRGVADENKRLRAETGKLKLSNQYLQSELQSANRVQALAAYQARSPSQTALARVIGTGAGANSRVVFIDRGSHGGVMRGMAVITPDGIVGKVIAAYPTASQVLLIDDPTFAAGVISQKHRVRGTVRGLGQSKCMVDYVQNEEQVDPGEWFYTSGDDGVFPKGLPVGSVAVVRPGNPGKQVFLVPSGLQGGLEEVLVVLEGAHQPIPDQPLANTAVRLQPPPAEAAAPPPGPGEGVLATEADRLRARYQRLGQVQGHKFGEGAPGSKPPDFNLNPDEAAARGSTPAAAAPAGQNAAPAAPPAPGAPAAGSKPESAPGPVQETPKPSPSPPRPTAAKPPNP